MATRPGEQSSALEKPEALCAHFQSSAAGDRRLDRAAQDQLACVRLDQQKRAIRPFVDELTEKGIEEATMRSSVKKLSQHPRSAGSPMDDEVESDFALCHGASASTMAMICADRGMPDGPLAWSESSTIVSSAASAAQADCPSPARPQIADFPADYFVKRIVIGPS
jgi:hypothetical protein